MKKWIFAVIFTMILMGNAFAENFYGEYETLKNEINSEETIKREDFFAMLGTISGNNISNELNYIFEDDDEIEPQYKKYVYYLANNKIPHLVSSMDNLYHP